ncbi:MAG: hypothetical protein FJ293_00615 [Planctomycetes bacterium]|nr:hypothetical protein [Planctomycetota bacterium]
MIELLPDWLRAWLEEPIVAAWLATLAWAAGVALLLQVVAVLGGGGMAKSGGATAIALALGFTAGVMTVVPGMPGLPPAERWQWCAWLVPATLLLLWFEEAHGIASVLRFLLHLALVVAIAWWLVRPSGRARDWSPLEAQIVWIGGGLALLLLLLLGERCAASAPAWRWLLPHWLAAATSVVLLAEQSDRLARCAGGLVAVLSVALLLGLAHRSAPTARSSFAVVVMALVSLLAYAWGARHLGGLSTALLLVVCASVVLPAGSGGGRKGWLIVGVGPIVACLAAWLVRAAT